MKSKRIKWLDFAKGFAIICVIIMHSMDNVSYSNKVSFALLFKDVLSIFAMPVFFSISGFLYKPTNSVHKFVLMLYKKCTSFIIPYIIFAILSIIIHMNNSYNPIICILLPLTYLWFLYSLFFIFIIFSILNLCKINWKLQLFISLICTFVSLFLPRQCIFPVIANPIKNTLGFMIFFELGVLIKKFNLLEYLNSNKLIYTLGVVWIILLIIHFKYIGLLYDTNFVYFNDIISKLISIPLCFSIFMRFPHNNIFNYLDKYGKYTLVIYMMQSPIISVVYVHIFLRPFRYLCIDHPLLIVFILIILTWYLCVFTCSLLKINLINFAFYPRKYFNMYFARTRFGKYLNNK